MRLEYALSFFLMKFLVERKLSIVVIFLMEDGEVCGSAHYRNIDESQIVEFLSPNDEKE